MIASGENECGAFAIVVFALDQFRRGPEFPLLF
jgi:hypothetical protein